MCGTAFTIREDYKKCSDCGYFEIKGEDYDIEKKETK